MRRCLITYEEISSEGLYSKNGLRKLSPMLGSLAPLDLTSEEQLREAAARSDKMSIQGVQPKLSAILKVTQGRFKIVDSGGKYILKPQCDFDEVPQNEAITMSLAAIVGIEVPVHGLLYSRDGSLTYFVKRFDRVGKAGKVPLEDFAQLLGASRETKYDSSMEQVASIIDNFCTFPAIQRAELFKRVVFCFLIGNEDMHLKNFSLITRSDVVELSPAYDLVNSTIALPRAREELALPVNGKKSNLKRSDLIDYFGMQRLGLNIKVIDQVLSQLFNAIPEWEKLIQVSFLSEKMKGLYIALLRDRSRALEGLGG